MRKMLWCLVLALAVSCGEDENPDDVQPEPAPLSLTGKVESLRCEGTDAVYTIRMSGNANLSCSNQPADQPCSGWPEEIVGERSFTLRCKGDLTYRHTLTCLDRRDPEATTVVMFATEAQEPPTPLAQCP